MTLGGLWHGASWTFVIWGALQGIGIAFVHGFRKIIHSTFSKKLPTLFWTIITFHFVTFCWILFRAPNLNIAFRIMTGPFTASTGNYIHFIQNHSFQLMIMAIFFLTHRFDSHKTIRKTIGKLPRYLFWIGIGLCWLLAMTMNVSSSDKFIYYDF